MGRDYRGDIDQLSEIRRKPNKKHRVTAHMRTPVDGKGPGNIEGRPVSEGWWKTLDWQNNETPQGRRSSATYFKHKSYIDWHNAGKPSFNLLSIQIPSRIEIAKTPSKKNITFEELQKDYGAISIKEAFIREIIPAFSRGLKLGALR